MDGDFYYRLHEVTRQYALERLGRAEGEAVRERHLAYYTRLAEQADPFLYRREQTVWLRRLDIELSNLRSALDWGTRQKDVRRLERTLRLASSLYYYWFLRSCFIEGLSWIERAMEAAARFEISAAIITLDKAASFAFYLGDYAKAKLYSDSFLMSFQDLHDPTVTIIAMRHTGLTALFYDEPEQARWFFREGLQKALEVGDEFNAARFLNDLGNLAASQGEVEQAYQLYRQELEVSLRSGDRFNLLYATGCLARASMRLGNMEEARLYTHESLIYSEELGYALGVAFAMETKAQLAFGREDLDEALGLWRKCLAIAWDRRYLEMVLDVLESLAKLLGAFGELHQSARLLGACHTARMEYRIKAWPILAQETVAHLGQIHRKLGDVNFNRAWEKGQQMTLEEMVRLALGENLLHQERVKAAEGEPSGGV
jgi:tetratricopeptide (TPR) repeat protein